MALALWAAAEPGPVAWVCLDEFDNRPGVLWAYIVAALRRSGVAVPTALPAARGRERGREADHVFLLGLAAALAAQDPPVTLVLDDLHLLTDPGVLDGLDYVLRNAGPGLRLVVSARMDPLLPLHRYRLAGQLAEIGTGDLAFTVAEGGLLLARHGHTLTAGSLERLTRRTEGWAAGLRLVAISMGTDPDPDQFVKELITDDSALTGYLVDEVLNAWPPAASIVIDGLAIGEIIEPRGTPSVADEFAGLPYGQAWTGPEPHLVSAAVALSAGRPASSTSALDAADGVLARLPADQQAESRLAAAMIRLAAYRRTGDFMAASVAAEAAEALVSRVPGDKLTRHPDVRARVLSGRGAVELWSGHLDEAARTFESGVAAATAPGGEDERAGCLGHLALAEALRGRLCRAAWSSPGPTRPRAISGQQWRPPGAPAAITRRRRQSPTPTRGRLPDTPRTRRARSHQCSPPAAGHPNAFGCRRG